MVMRFRWFMLGVVAAVMAVVSVRNPAFRSRLLHALRAAGTAAITAATEQLRQG